MLKAQNLACRRGRRMVFRDIGFTVESGGVLLVTGANGSGKSSLLQVLAGLIAPAQGAVSWHGEDIFCDAAADHRARLHYSGHLDAVKPGLTVREILDYWRVLRGSGDAAALSDCLDAFALRNLVDRPVRSLSAGQKRRLSLTKLVLHRAVLWLLDEPLTSLDKQGQQLLYAQLARHRANGGVTVIATHEKIDIAQAHHLEITEVK